MAIHQAFEQLPTAVPLTERSKIYAGLRPRESSMTEAFLDGLEHYPVDRELGRYAGLLKNEWATQGRTLSIPDVIIAATALAYKLVLMTDNRKDFPMPELAMFSWPDSR